MKLPILDHLACPHCGAAGLIKWQSAKKAYHCDQCHGVLPVMGFTILVEGVVVLPPLSDDAGPVRQAIVDFVQGIRDLVDQHSREVSFIPSQATFTELPELDDSL